jgi:hypothetical protein
MIYLTSPDYKTSNDVIINEKYVGNYMKGSGRGLI